MPFWKPPRLSNVQPRRTRCTADGSDRGSITVIAAVSLVPLLVMATVVVDAGRTRAERQQLQTAVEFAALGAGYDRINGGSGCAGVPDAVAGAVSSTPTVTCSETGELIVVGASVTRSLTFPGLVGRSDATVSASTGVKLGGTSAMTGLRPLALCGEHPGFEAWVASGFTDSNLHRVDVESDGSTCAGQAPGNWGMLDLDGGSNANSDTQEWINSGFPGEIQTFSQIDGDPGIPTPAIGIDEIYQTPVAIPVFADVTANGQGASYTIVGFVGIVIESAVLNGPAAQRHLMVRFTTEVANAATRRCCTGPGEVHGGLTAARICSLDDMGVC
jgi:hypothetical protein